MLITFSLMTRSSWVRTLCALDVIVTYALPLLVILRLDAYQQCAQAEMLRSRVG